MSLSALYRGRGATTLICFQKGILLVLLETAGLEKQSRKIIEKVNIGYFLIFEVEKKIFKI